LTHHAFPALRKDYIHRGAGKAFVDSIRERSIKWQLLLGGDRAVNEALRQTPPHPKLEVIKLAVGSPIRLQKASDRALWRSPPHRQSNEDIPTVYMLTL
jgi:hypothetical protein